MDAATTQTLNTVIIGVVCILLGATAGFFLGRAKSQKKPGGTMLIGIRASSHVARVRHVTATRGRVAWKEPGDFEADIHLQGDMLYPLGDGGFMQLIDLDSYHPIEFCADCASDAAADAKLPEAERKQKAIAGAASDLVRHPMEYRGVCSNDDEETPVEDRQGNVTATIKGVWRRIPGTRLLKMRKDSKIEQMHNSGQAWYMALVKFTPIAIIVIGVVMLIILGLVGKMALSK